MMNVLLHMCCAPCSMYPIDLLKQKGHHVTGLYFNPNIHPYEEFLMRKNTVLKLEAFKQIQVIMDETYDETPWKKMETSKHRCDMCYHTRLQKTFEKAVTEGFDAVSTTLLSSPHQNHDIILKQASALAKYYDIQFIHEDFQSGYIKGQEEAKQLGLYRQHYCGCIASLKERIEEIKLNVQNGRYI
jgi:epoxyqueuosine reductase